MAMSTKITQGRRIRDASLRDAPRHEANREAGKDNTHILKSRTKRGVSKDEARDLPSAALYRLLAWLSPSYPVGAFSYSSGLEWAVETDDVNDADTLRAWLGSVISAGGMFCDAVFFAHAHRAIARNDRGKLHDIAELAAAFTPSRERQLETMAQGQAFLQTTSAAWPTPVLDLLTEAWDGPVCYPVAVAVAAAGHGVALEPALHAYLHAVA